MKTVNCYSLLVVGRLAFVVCCSLCGICLLVFLLFVVVVMVSCSLFVVWCLLLLVSGCRFGCGGGCMVVVVCRALFPVVC